MNLQLEKWIFNGNISYKLVNLELCCNQINNNNIIDFHKGQFNNFYSDNEDEIGIALHEINPEIDYDDGNMFANLETNDVYYKINKCPFCGEDICIEIVNEINKTEEYLELQTKANNLRQLINKCDSKKKTDKLEQEFRKINDEMNSYHSNITI